MARHLIADCDMFTVIRFKQRTRAAREAAWLEERTKGVGGSDMGAILGVNPWTSPYHLWLEKTGREPHEDISDKWSVVMGNALEPELRRRFRRLHPEWECHDGTGMSLVSRMHPVMHASLDGILWDERRGFGVLEIKTANAMSGRRDWHDADGNLKAPDHYLALMTHYLAVTGWSCGVFYAYIGESEPVEVLVERDEDDVSAVVTAAERFWRFVDDDVPPAMSSGDVDEVQQAAKPEGFEQVEDADYDRLAALWKQFDDAEKTARKQRDGIAAQLKELVGPDRRGLISEHWQTGYRDVNYKAQPEKVIPAKDAYTQRRFFVKQL